MMRIEPEISGVSVVLLGKFNPTMLTPSWLAFHGVFTKQEAKEAELQVSHNQLSSFSTEWLVLQVTPDRLFAQTSRAPHIRLGDLLVRLFKEQLLHAPINAIGINRDVHFLAPTAKHRDNLGRRLAPLDPWADGAGIVDFSGEPSGLVSLSMRQGNLEGRPVDDNINVRVESSNIVGVGAGGSGVYVGVNDHYSLASSDNGVSRASNPSVILSKNFEKSVKHSDQIVDYVMSLAKSTVAL